MHNFFDKERESKEAACIRLKEKRRNDLALTALEIYSQYSPPNHMYMQFFFHV